MVARFGIATFGRSHSKMSSVVIEFYGIARERAQRPSVEIATDGPVSLSSLLTELSERLPVLVPDCITDGRLSVCCAANINGDRFVTDAAEPIQPKDRLLLLSADAGG